MVIQFAILLRCYRRKTGQWPKPWRRGSRPPIHQNPFGARTYASRWQAAAAITPPEQPVGDGDHANFRPTPPGDKRYNAITERISSHLHEASEKLSKQRQNVAERDGPAQSVCKDVRRASLRTSSDTATKTGANLLRSCRSYDGEVGLYQDRTLPATLMMTNESKKQKFANEAKALKRSNSATLRSSLKGKGSRNPNKSGRLDSGRMQVYNDFGSHSNMSQYRIKGKTRRTSNISSFVSSKPSNTSDYVSDLETVLTDRTITNHRRLSISLQDGRKSLYSETDFTFQGSVINTSDGLDRKLPFEVNQQSNTRLSHKEAMGQIKGKLKEAQQLYIDDRTESQQNTMKSELYHWQEIPEEERSTIEGQSSDTESMAESAYTAGTRENSFQLKRRHYNSDNEFLRSGSSTRNRTKRKQCRRSRSDGWDSEPSASGSQKRSQSRNPSRPRTRRQRGFVNYSYEDHGSIEKLKMPHSQLRLEANTESPGDVSSTNPRSPGHLEVLPTLESSSLKPPKIGTVMEMPIYSQSTWSARGAVKQKKNNRKAKISKSSIGPSRNPPKVRKNAKAGRKLSIGGGGRYFCEYGSLPVDLSKLPKDLVEKLGGKTDKLLEPIDKLNFDMLCRPLPSLGKTESQNSARRLVVDRLPPNHQDREIFKNTYEYDTGLVTTDL